ncbi:MAG: VWA domain-containing protein [Terracidiphilus sp.]
MAHLSYRLIPALVFATSLTLPSTAQNSSSQSQPAQSQPQATGNQAIPSDFTVHTYTRMVNLELVVKDSKGNHIQGLKPEDFEIEEQTPAKSGKWSGQKIAEFREVHMAGLAAPVEMQPEMPPGTYTNALKVQQDPVPPTVILVDGLNTDPSVQAQVHVQMLKMLRQLPPNVPVAVFILGDRLTLLQSFTTDPKLLQAALNKVMSTAGVGLASVNPMDDAGSAASMAAEAASGDPHAADIVAGIAAFDQRVYVASMDERVFRTIDALTSLGHNLSGYPGRKNLLWLSTSFPIGLFGSLAVGAQSGGGPGPEVTDLWSETGGYLPLLRNLNAVLSDAKVAVYPVNPAGVQTLTIYQAGTRSTAPPPTIDKPDSSSGLTGPLAASHASGMADIESRDIINQNAEVDTMHNVADGTGGIVCTGDNDLGDCVRKAMDDSSDFYEIAYYSDSEDWNGEFRKVEVRTGLHGARLEYREGYFANPEGSPDTSAQAKQLKSDCDDYLNATSVPFTVKNLPPDSPDQLKLSLAVDPSAVTFLSAGDGGRQLNLDVAVCTYNAKDWPLNLMNYPVNLKLSEQKFNGLMTTGKLTDTILVPGPRPAAIRLLVKDVSTGKLGSVYIKTNGLLADVPKLADDPNAVVQQ